MKQPHDQRFYRIATACCSMLIAASTAMTVPQCANGLPAASAVSSESGSAPNEKPGDLKDLFFNPPKESAKSPSSSLPDVRALFFSPQTQPVARPNRSSLFAKPQLRRIEQPPEVRAKLKEILAQTRSAYGATDPVTQALGIIRRWDVKLSMPDPSNPDKLKKLDLSIVTKGNKFWAQYGDPSLLVTMGINGDTRWSKIGSRVYSDDEVARRLTAQAEQHQSSLRRSAGPITLSDDSSFSLLPDQQVRGIDCYVVEHQSEGETTRIFIDKELYFIARIQADVSHDSSKFNYVLDLFDHFRVAGVAIPHKIDVQIGSGSKSYTAKFVIDASNEEVADSLFATPADYVVDTKGGGSTVIPFELRNGAILVKVRANDTPMTMIVDTGTGCTCLSAKSAEQLGQTEPFEREAKTIGGSVKVKTLKLRQFGMGGIVIHDYPIDVIKFGFDTACDGLLGGDFLRKYVVTVDYVAREITLTSPGSYVLPSAATVVPLTIIGRNEAPMMFLQARLNNLEVPLLVDTGCDQTLIPYSLVSAVLDQPQYTTTVGGVEGQQLKAADIHVRTLQIGDISNANACVTVFEETAAQVQDRRKRVETINRLVQKAEPNLRASDMKEVKQTTRLVRAYAHSGSLGELFLQQYPAVAFDYQGKRLILDPTPRHAVPAKTRAAAQQSRRAAQDGRSGTVEVFDGSKTRSETFELHQR